MSVSSIGLAENTTDPLLKSIFQKPLILGASVSNDYFTESPGKRLALRYTSDEKIKVIARNGTPGKEIIKNLHVSDFENRSVIIGFDLFFWDSFHKSSHETLAAMNTLMHFVSQADVPVILAEVPVFTPELQPSALKINQRLREICQTNSRCRLLPLDRILRKIVADGFIVQNGQRYTLAHLLPDGLHIAAPASEYLANQIKVLF